MRNRATLLRFSDPDRQSLFQMDTHPAFHIFPHVGCINMTRFRIDLVLKVIGHAV